MPKIKYVETNFQQKTLELIELANTIIEDYQLRGYELTLRQLYYQLVARDLIPNNEKSYNRLGSVISSARDAGLVDWNAIVDRTRSRQGLQAWDNPGQIVEAAYRSFRIDKWENQDYRIFVWVEKEALAGVVSRACRDEDIQVDYVSCRGYMSASTIWREARGIERWVNMGKRPIIIHLGDHDPSGVDMTRDNLERIERYGRVTERVDFDFIRLALNMDQVRQYNPPPNPAKLSDSRAERYISEFGYESWELDALDPDVLVTMIRDKIESYRDVDEWNKALAQEDEHKATLKYVWKNWESLGEDEI